MRAPPKRYIMTKRIENGSSAPQNDSDALRILNAQLEQRHNHDEIELDAARAGLDTLAHFISHDLCKPLNIIGGFAELLMKHSGGDIDEKGRHYLERITTATAQIGRMQNDVLALSRMSQTEMHRMPVDIDRLVRKIVEDLKAEKGDRRVIWLIGSLPTVRADPSLIREAFMSLLSNALKFTLSREVARIQVGAQDGDGGVRFYVRDNGASFDIGHRERFFDVIPGYQPSTAPTSGAIRLAYVQRIIQRHGGRMWTEALPDGGASFYFSLSADIAGPDFDPSHR
jgi:signal transduction histidine kinase